MKWLIASDIHGSAYFCRQLMQQYEAEQADRLLLLGDLLYHGPRNDLPQEYAPKAVISLLNARKSRLLCVRGNCEAEVDQAVLSFPVLAEYALLTAGASVIFASHGHHFHADAMPPLMPGDILLHGHTHIPECRAAGQCFILNPGSVSIPKNGSDHSYMLLEDDVFTWKSLPDRTPYRVWKAGTPVL